MSETMKPQIRDGEETLDFDPGNAADAMVAFIGRIGSPWTTREDCPRNIGSARASGQGAVIRLDPAYLRGLTGLVAGRHLMVIYWMDRARRDLILQTPHHADGPRGTFALRSPNRPNPLAMSCVTITEIDRATGEIGIDAIDCLDGTPVVDIKPWLPGIDTPAGAEVEGV
jgi:tRNA-Thr(GGU) m(6)t(6)A37 methyltransferase TsaA